MNNKRIGMLLLSMICMHRSAWAQSGPVATSSCDELPIRLAEGVSVPFGEEPPEALASADLDGDGDVDLMFTRSMLRVLLNRGDGTFAGPLVYSDIGGIGTIPVADFDQDGDLDIAGVAAQDGGIGVLPNRGDGTFAAVIESLPGVIPYQLAGGDVDGDGDVDLVMLDFLTIPGMPSPPATLRMLLNDGTGHFLMGDSFPLGLIFPGQIALGDIDLDGRLDLVVPVNEMANGSILIMRNGSNGVFEDPQRLTYANHFLASVTVADLNADRYPELIVVDSLLPGAVGILRNTGVGTFGDRVQWISGTSAINVAVGDLDQDSAPEIIAPGGHPDNRMAVLRNDGAGQFSRALELRVPGDVVVAELDGDMAADLAILDRSASAVRTLINRTPHPEANDCIGQEPQTHVPRPISASSCGAGMLVLSLTPLLRTRTCRGERGSRLR